MKIIILGVGKVGETLLKNLINEGHDIVAVDKDEKALNYVANKYDVKGVYGAGLERDVLIESGIEEADLFISCTLRDEMNILACVLAKKLGAKRTVARVRDPEYFKEMENMRTDLGLDLVFNPELRTAIEIENVLEFPSAKNVESFAGGKATLVEFDITAHNPMVGKTIKDISINNHAKVLFAMVSRGDKVFIPRGDFVIEKNDSIHVLATEQELSLFCKGFKLFKPRAKSVFIVGGGKIGYYLAKDLLEKKVAVKILENDKARCQELSEELIDATVLLGDGTDQETLDEENIKGCDACVSLTGIDEENIIMSLYAIQSGVGKVVTKIDRENVISMVKKLGLDSIVSPNHAIANHIIRFVRAHNAETGSGISTLYKLGDKAEAVEFVVGEDFPWLNVKLKDMKVKYNVLVGGIVRDGEFSIANGETCLKNGDKVIIFTTAKRTNSLTDICK